MPSLSETIDAANREALRRLHLADPVLVDVASASEVLSDLSSHTMLHAGPPIAWEGMCGPMRGAVAGAALLEHLALSPEEAEQKAACGAVKFAPNHHHGGVGPMAGITTRSMPVLVVQNRAFGNTAYCVINEGLGKVLRFGANDETVVARLRWIAAVLAPALRDALRRAGGIPLRPLMARALTMGDEMHQRNVAASSLFFRAVAPHVGRLGLPPETLGQILEFVGGNDQFFLNLAMAAGKASLDPLRGIPACTVVTAMARNGRDFGIQVSGFSGRWFTAPVNTPRGLYFPGFTEADANPDLGDSAIVETLGLGGFAMAAAPAVIQFVGAGNYQDGVRITREMGEITLDRSPHYQIPALDFEGVPTGIDIRKVVATGITPLINTGIAHRQPGVGQVGAGTVRASAGAFEAAVEAFAAEYAQ